MTKLTSIAMASLALLAGAGTHAQSAASKVYIIQLRDEPAASYQGTTAGYAATAAGVCAVKRAPGAAWVAA